MTVIWQFPSTPDGPTSIAVQVAAGTAPSVYSPPFSTPSSVIAGASPSTLTGPTVVLASLSALSTAFPVAASPCPSTCVPVQVAIPDCTLPVSAHANVTVTALLYQPLEPSVPLGVAEIVGLVLSSFTVTESVPRLPAKSSADPLTSWPAVSVLRRTSGVIVAGSTPEAPSSALSTAEKCTVVSSLFQPRAFAATGRSVCDTVGATSS